MEGGVDRTPEPESKTFMMRSVARGDGALLKMDTSELGGPVFSTMGRRPEGGGNWRGGADRRGEQTEGGGNRLVAL